MDTSTRLKLGFASLMILSGIGVASYPVISNMVAQRHASTAIQNYDETVHSMDTEKLDAAKEAARRYNQQLGNALDRDAAGEAEDTGTSYVDLIDVGESLGYITIPKIDVNLPIYEGTSDDVLLKGVGHLEGSSYPLGGESTHSVLTGHRGLAEAVLFTDLDKLQEGDKFYLHIMDEVLAYGLKNLLVSLIVVFSVVNLTSTLLSTVRQWILIFLSIKIDIPLMLGYFEHVYKLPMKFFASRKTGEITTRYSDAGTIKSVLTSIAMSVVMDIVMAVGTGFVLFRMNSSLFSITLFTTVLSLLLVIIFKQPYKRINEETMVQSAVLNSQMIESLRGIETIKCNACEERELEALEREYIKSLKISLRSSKISTGQSLISSVIMTVLNMVTTYVGITQVLNGQLTLGGYMAFSTLSGYFTSPVSELISMQMSIQEASISMKRLTEIMDYESEQDDDHEYTEMESMEGDIEFKDVTFRYGNRTPALDHISFTIPQGKKVALVGSSGSGKSTITKLLLKYYEPESGTISVNGVDLDEYSNASVRRCISYVPQNVELFSKTIFENIRISRPEATLDQVREAAKKADAHEFIRKLPLQYNTYLEEAGNGLSGGEKQRIALARAFLKDSSLYIFDESTSSLDFGTENTIFDMIYNQLADRSMLIVAHRLSTIRDCDLILVMDHGQIVERGTHDELLAKQGKYYELWNLQQGIFRRKKEEPAPVAPAAVVEEDDDGEAMTY